MMNKKRILSVFMALCMIFGMVLCTQVSVSAKSNASIKIGFSGKKTITVNTGSEPSLRQIEKKWGEKTRLADSDEEWPGEAYVWEKGKTKISIRESEGSIGYISIDINDKNATVAGVKVGMKKDTALKELQGIYGKGSVVELKDGQYAVSGENNSLTAEGKGKGAYTSIMAAPEGYMPISFGLKNGKVSSISWFRS